MQQTMFGTRIAISIMLVLTPRYAITANVADFIDFSLRNSSNQVILPGRLYVPPEASNPAVPRPFILFLHGAGDAGTDNVSQVSNNDIDNLLAEAKRRGAFLYAPQTSNAWNGFSRTDNVMTMINRAIATQNVDSHRLYDTGLSAGGGGAWNMISRYPGVFAAALPLSGTNPFTDFTPSHLLNEPIWTFHARDDTTVLVDTTRNVIDSILTADGQPSPIFPASGSTVEYLLSNPDLPSHRVAEDLLRQQGNLAESLISGSNLDLLYSELPTGGHTIFSSVYNMPAIYDWMFAHTTLVPEPAMLIHFLTASALLLPLRLRRS